jgi:hypothetical protein
MPLSSDDVHLIDYQFDKERTVKQAATGNLSTKLFCSMNCPRDDKPDLSMWNFHFCEVRFKRIPWQHLQETFRNKADV